MAENRVSNIEAPAHVQFFAPERLPGEFLSSLGVQAMSDFFSIEMRMTLPAGANLYREGDAPSEVYVLLDGNVRISFDSNSGRRFIFKTAKPGGVLGLASVVTGRPHATTAEVIFPARVSTIRRRDFLAFLQRRPEATWAAMREIGFESERAYGRLRTMGLSNSVCGRLARLILEWTSFAQGAKRGRQLHVPMTHCEIGDSIGASRESVTRAISDLQRDRVIEVHGALLTILNTDELEVRSLK
jgi:CRP/FNR family transcriptional regulator